MLRSLVHKAVDRIRDEKRPPAKWWHPEHRNMVFQSEREAIEYHAQISKSLRSAMFSLILFSLFCLLTLGAPDSQLITLGQKLKIPFANVPVSFSGFLIVAPLLLVCLTVYLHTYLDALLRMPRLESSRLVPCLFNLDSPVAQWTSIAIFYWVCPLVLAVFLWKALPFGFAVPFGLMILTFSVAIALVILYIRRWRGTMKPNNYKVLWVIVGLIASVGIHDLGRMTFDGCRAIRQHVRTQAPEVFVRYRERYHPFWMIFVIRKYMWDLALPRRVIPSVESRLLWRPLFLDGAKLDGENFDEQDFSFATMEKANLSGASLRAAYMRGVVLTGANLRGAILQKAVLRSATLRGADLSGADLRQSELTWAELVDANLDGADLRGCADLTCVRLRETKNWSRACRDDRLRCGADIPCHPEKRKSVWEDIP